MASRGQLEIGKVKPWSHRAAHQAPGVTLHRGCGKPAAGWHHMLGSLAASQLKADLGAANLAACIQFKDAQAAATVVVPELIGADAVPARALACR